MNVGKLKNGLQYVLKPLCSGKDGPHLVTVATVYSVGSYDELGTQQVSFLCI